MNFNYNLYPGRKKYKRKCNNVVPIISIITPFFNSGEYIRKTADSVLGQTFEDFEWIIVDDGSTDSNSLEKLNNLEKEDNRISVYHKENAGLAHTRDYGVSKSSNKSKYLVFLDDDDLINETFLECCFWALEKNKDASWAYVDTVNFGKENYLWRKWFDSKKEKKENLLVAMAMVRKIDFIKVNRISNKRKSCF